MLLSITAKVRNGLLFKYRIEQGGISQKVAAAKAGVNEATWNALETMRFDRVSQKGLRVVASFLECDPLDLCPDKFRDSDCRLVRTVYQQADVDHMLGYEMSKQLCLPDPSEEAACQEVKDVRRATLLAVLDTLNSRDRAIIKMRYGLNDDGVCYTLLEIAKVYKITRKRAREVEAQALRKLQHPVRATLLEQYV